MSARIFIPARMKSERLPNKPLKYIGDKTLIEHVYTRAKKTGYPVTILTDNEEIMNKYPNWDVVITDDCYTGTDRVASVINNYNEKYIVNCQGDLPFITSNQIIQSIIALEYADVGTLVAPMEADKINDVNTVKAITSKIDGPFHKVNWCGRGTKYGDHHIGVYAFTKKTLLKYPKQRSLAETIENLEQLRWLENNFSICAVKTDCVPIEVNTEEDLKIANDRVNSEKR